MAEIAPWFVSAPEKVEARETDTLQVTVSFGGYPEPRVEWSRDGDVLTSGDEYHTVEVGGTSTLSVPRVSRHHAGVYTVTASNSAGTATARIRVKILRMWTRGSIK